MKIKNKVAVVVIMLGAAVSLANLKHEEPKTEPTSVSLGPNAYKIITKEDVRDLPTYTLEKNQSTTTYRFFWSKELRDWDSLHDKWPKPGFYVLYELKAIRNPETKACEVSLNGPEGKYLKPLEGMVGISYNSELLKQMCGSEKEEISIKPDSPNDSPIVSKSRNFWNPGAYAPRIPNDGVLYDLVGISYEGICKVTISVTNNPDPQYIALDPKTAKVNGNNLNQDTIVKALPNVCRKGDEITLLVRPTPSTP